MKTKILRFSIHSAKLAGKIVKDGGVIVFPTDTVYGVGCDPFNDESVKRVYEIKRRIGKPMPILAKDLNDIERIAEISEVEFEIISRLWPGQLTILLNARPNFRISRLVSEDGRVGVRIPACLQTLIIINESGGLLVGTSANISGLPPPRSIQELDEKILRSVDLTIDGGRCLIGKPSTVIELVDKNRLRVLRLGSVTIEKLKEICEELDLTLDIESCNPLKD
ncbi:MAG: threonylcarbamoyl-AMP synthase [Thaumarchaeota archaeon]|nr:MAG: threonylcarbamoyl-AMP synthase [Nitrososphaerota archaeon]